MSEKSSRTSPQSKDKLKGPSDISEQISSEKLHFDDDIFPISPRESPSPSNSSRHPHHRSSRRHRHSSSGRDRDRHQTDSHSSPTRKNRKHRGKDLKEIEDELSSERKRCKVYHEGKSGDKRSRKERDRSRTKESKKGHRKPRSHEKEEVEKRKNSKDKRSRGHEYVDDRESYYQYDKEKSVEPLKRDHSCSVSRKSSLAHYAIPHEIKNSPQSSTKGSLCPFVATLLKPLLKEETSDAELEELLPAGILSGEIAKRSIPLPQALTADPSKRGLTLQNHSQASHSQSHELKTDSSIQQQSTSLSESTSDSKQQPADENESHFDAFLSNLSDRLQEKEQEVETWKSGGGNEIDFSDILLEEEDAIRMAASAASLKPKQLLEACLSTPWDSLERRMEDEDGGKSEKTAEEKEAEDPFDLVSLLSANISRRYLDEELVKELEERGICLPSTAAAAEKGSSSVDAFKSRMVPGVYEEYAWRRSLLGGIIGV